MKLKISNPSIITMKSWKQHNDLIEDWSNELQCYWCKEYYAAFRNNVCSGLLMIGKMAYI